MLALEETANDHTIIIAVRIRQKYINDWNALLSNKFIAEMANDSLPLKKFIFYLRQDHLFLKEFCTFLKNAREKVAEADMKQFFDSVYKGTVNYEMPMQSDLLSSLGISAEESEIKQARATSSYVSFLRNTSSSGRVNIMISAMAPCPWSYLEIAERLSHHSSMIGTEAYRRWIQFYASEESKLQVKELKAILGRVYHKSNQATKKLMEQHFATACKHEHNFWEMAYSNEEK